MSQQRQLEQHAKRLLDEELAAREPQLQRALQQRRNAALAQAEAPLVPAYNARWWLAGTAACALAVVLALPGLRSPLENTPLRVAGDVEPVAATADVEIVEVLDNLELLLFFEEDGIDLEEGAGTELDWLG